MQHLGNGLALDDVGVDPMSLAFLPVLEPEVIKLDMFGRPAPIEQAGDRFDVAAAGLLRAPRPGFHQPGSTPFDTAAGLGSVVAGTADAVMAALARLHDTFTADDTAVVIASRSAEDLPGIAVPRWETAGREGSVMLLDEPLPGEFAAVVIGAGYGLGVCVRGCGPLAVVSLDHLPAVAAVTRALLAHHR